MNVHEYYRKVNLRLHRGEHPVSNESKRGVCIAESAEPRDASLRKPHIGVYAGTGTSHSWLWFVDMFDSMGFHALRFPDENDVASGALDNLDVLAVSGGDTFAVAAALGPEGALRLRAFIERGGLYIGSCAGAYLPMNSSKPDLNLFNFAGVKIANLSKTMPEALQMSYKCSAAYGCDYIFHPVREDVRIQTHDIAPFTGTESLIAPMYGGPPMIPSGNAEVLATYEDFTEKTLFLVDEKLARDTMLGKAAAVRTSLGKGRLYLFGPHFEHPGFPEANKLVAETVIRETRNACVRGQEAPGEHDVISGNDRKALLRGLRRELSNSRIVATGMELLPLRWTIGRKVYAPEKVRVFLEAMWGRLKTLEAHESLRLRRGHGEELASLSVECTRLLRQIKSLADRNIDAVEPAAKTFAVLNRFSRTVLDMYMKTVSQNHCRERMH